MEIYDERFAASFVASLFHDEDPRACLVGNTSSR